MSRTLELEILPQPDDQTCGVTCLHAVYGYYGLQLPLNQLINEVEHLDSGGTLCVLLGCDALKRGFDATLYTYNLNVFDPTWFGRPNVNIQERLLRQATFKDDPRLTTATRGYVEFLDLGGRIKYEDLNPNLLRRFLKKGKPILTGLSATYLYDTAREFGPNDDYDDIRGAPSGHFVVVVGYKPQGRHVEVADPWLQNPITGDDQRYSVGMDRLLAAILLGIVTFDANLLVIEPKKENA
ncbi:MAG: C39 family peptidase [Planctomycetes bacterium]|nr:C39 family peptidase [Planctomycetota bacterium]